MEAATCSESVYNSPILIVGAETDDAMILEDELRRQQFQQVVGLDSVQEALEIFPVFDPELVLLVWRSREPGSDEAISDLLEQVKQHRIPLIVIVDNRDARQRGSVLWTCATDLLVRPFDGQEVGLRVKNLLDIRRSYLRMYGEQRPQEILLEEQNHRLEKAFEDVLMRLARTVEDRLYGGHTHLDRVGELSARIGLVLGMSRGEAKTLRGASQLHDVGNGLILDAVLCKPAELSESEVTLMRQHTMEGARLLQPAGGRMSRMAESIALTHHERWDGTGYPYGLKGSAIPLESRIVAVADVFDALRHERPHRRALPFNEAVGQIRSKSGSHFDPRVVRAFDSLLRGDPQLRFLEGTGPQII